MCVPGTEFCPCDGAACMDGLSCVDDVCQPYACGNGIPEPGEPCDDGNDDFTDALHPRLQGRRLRRRGPPGRRRGMRPRPRQQRHRRVPEQLQAASLRRRLRRPRRVLRRRQPGQRRPLQQHLRPRRLAATASPRAASSATDGNANNNDACLSSCVIASCGDGQLYNGNEECDDGNGSNNDACLATCKVAKCGDGQLYNGVEQCDDGNANNADGCSNACQKVAQLVGSYNVNSGPAWGGNPPTYTCKEACALLYGGQAGQYTCSVTNQAPTGQAYMSGYADGQYCTNPNSDNFKLNVNYNCGVFGCSYSAYVNDNCYQGTSINYCWKL
jgi:cysteine-rich repeat protein